MERGLVGFDAEQIITARREHPPAEGPLTKERIAGEHPARPVDPLDQVGSTTEFRLRLVPSLLDRFAGQHHPMLMTEGHQGMDGGAVRLELDLTSLGLPIDGDALTPPLGGRRHKGRGKRGGQGSRGM